MAEKISISLMALLLILIVFLAAYLRIIDTSVRPLHNDEGVNYHFLQEIHTRGYYPYSHENYHGPSYFYLSRGFVDIFGDDELGLRSSAIFCGVASILLLLLLLKQEGWLFVLLAALFMSFSSSLVYYSRYAIHETLFCFAGLLSALSIVRWWFSGQAKWILIGFLGVALLISTKETFIITLFCLFFASLAMGDISRIWQLLLKQKYVLGIGSALCAFFIVFIFSAGLKWPAGLREMILAVPQWVNRNKADYGHHKPFAYYAEMITQTESGLLAIAIVLLLLGIFRGKDIAFLLRREAAFGRFLLAWSLLAFLVYSLVSYKTPWLVINMTLPATLLLAWLITRFIQTRGVREAGIVTALAISFWSAKLCWKYNFEIPYGQKNPFSYVHTSPGMMDFLSDLDKYWRKNPSARVLIGVDQYWPLPYYTRARAAQVHYVKSEVPESYTNRYEVIVMHHLVKKDLPDFNRKYYRLSDVQESQVYFRISAHPDPGA